jgi:hypothetical protein
MSLDQAHGALSAQSVLHTWEQAQAMDPLRRSLALLRLTWREVAPGDWGALPIGARDARLFALQDTLFGPDLDTLVACPACSEPLQTRFSTADLQPHGTEAGTGEAPASLRCDGYELGYRLPCSDDLLALVDMPGAIDDAAETAETAETTAKRLLEHCVLDARHDGAPAAVADLPPAVVDQLQQEMARRDPGADTRVALVCPACGHAFERRFDIGAYLWDTLDDWAQRTLSEVHLLASAYGWSEPQILALSAARRSHYIALVQA